MLFYDNQSNVPITNFLDPSESVKLPRVAESARRSSHAPRKASLAAPVRFL